MKIGAKKFKKKTGHEPKDDDLHRANCNEAGNFGHYMCGWCSSCDLPRFQCGHSVQAQV